MVSVSEEVEQQFQLILRPDQSLSWRGNQILLFFIASWLLCFALLFAYAGAWMVLPFVGLEVVALGAAFYCVSHKLTWQQVLEIDSQEVRLTAGRRRPEVSRVFRRGELLVRIVQPPHEWGCPIIELYTRNSHPVRLGEFLNRDDCQQLIRILKRAGLPTRQCSELVDLSF